MAKSTKRYFEIDSTLKNYPSARYYFLLGARGCGKTYPVMKKAIKDAIDGNGVFAYVRRYKDAITETKLQDLCSPLNQWVAEYTDGAWNKINYWRHRWYLERWEENEDTGEWTRVDKNPTPLGIAVAMNTWENDKGPDFGADKGGMAHIILDEALSAGGNYLVDEWGKFQNVISSFVRDRWEKDTKIWLLANPVSKYGGPYLKNLGLSKSMLNEFGTYEITYPSDDGKPDKNGMRTVFVYIAASTTSSGKTTSVDDARTMVYKQFFAFPNSKGKSKSITHGYWEMEDANGLDSGIYKDSENIDTVWVKFDEELLAIDIMCYEDTGVYYLFIRPSNEIPRKRYFITLSMSLSEYAILGIRSPHPVNTVIKKILQTNQVYFSDFETADIWHGFLHEDKLQFPASL